MEKVQIDTDRYSELLRKECLLDIVVGLFNTDNSYIVEEVLKAVRCVGSENEAVI